MLEFAGLCFRGLTLADVFREDMPGMAHVVTVNAEYIVRAHENARLAHIIGRATATFDGQLPYALARWRNPGRHVEKLPGSELVYHVCERAHRHAERVFLLGGDAASNRDAVDALRRRYPGLAVAGYSPPHSPYPFGPEHEQNISARIYGFAPQYLLVGFGVGKQDFWIDDHRTALCAYGVKLAVGVGGSFDMISGRLKRAPRWVQRAGLEGVYRLALEPRWFRVRRLLLSLRFLRFV